MKFVKKHPFFLLWVAGLIACIVCKVSFLYIFLGTLAYLVLYLLIRLPRTAFFLGFFLEGRLHKPDSAMKLYDYGYTHGARVGAPMIAYGMQLLKRGSFEKGLTVLQDVLMVDKLDPNFLKVARQDLAIAYWANGDLSTAISTLELMLEDYEYFTDEFYSTLGYFYIEAKDYEKAEAISNRALKENESNGPVYDNLGLIAYEKGDKEEAEELFIKALDLRDTMTSSRYYLGLIAEEKGDSEAAAAYFSAAHNGHITAINTVPKEQIDQKYREYFPQA